MMPRNRQWVSERERGRGLASSHSRWAAARAQWRPAPPERHPRPGGARRRPARCCARRSASPIGDNPALGASHGRRSCAPRPGPLAAAGTPTGPKDYAQDLAHWPAVRGHKALRLGPRRSVSNSWRASNIRSPPAALPPPFRGAAEHHRSRGRWRQKGSAAAGGRSPPPGATISPGRAKNPRFHSPWAQTAILCRDVSPVSR